MVDIVIERPNTGNAFLTKQGGGLQPQAKLQLVVDGYSAPITAGNFVRNVQRGMYDNTKLSSNYISVTIAPSEPSPTGGEVLGSPAHACMHLPMQRLVAKTSESQLHDVVAWR